MKNLKQNSNKKFTKEFIAKYPKFSSLMYSKENLDKLMKLIKIEVVNKLNKTSALLKLREHADWSFTRKNYTEHEKLELSTLPFEIYDSSIAVNNHLVSVLGRIIYRTEDYYEIQLNKIFFQEPIDKSYILSLIDVLAHEIVHGFVFKRFKDAERYFNHASQTHANDGHPFFEKCLKLVGVSSTKTESNLKIYHTFQCEHKGCANRLSYFRKATNLANRYVCSAHDGNFVYIGRYDYTTLSQANTQNIRL